MHIPSVYRHLILSHYPCQIDRPRCAYTWSIHDVPMTLGRYTSDAISTSGPSRMLRELKRSQEISN